MYRYVYKWSCIFHFIIYLFIILFIFFALVCVVHVYMYVCMAMEEQPFWLNGHDLTLNIEH